MTMYELFCLLGYMFCISSTFIIKETKGKIIMVCFALALLLLMLDKVLN